MSLREIKPNVCYVGDLCETKERKKCEKKNECLVGLSENDKKEIANVSPFKYYEYGDKIYKKIERVIKKWRKEMFKKCKKVVFNISR